MKQVELYYQKPREEPFQARSLTNRKLSGSIGEDTPQRVVRLHTSGQSIESITKEVGRARHYVVHVLQSKGLYGNRPTESDDSKISARAVEEEPASEILKTEGVEKPTTANSRRKQKLSTKPKDRAKTQPKVPKTRKTPVTGRWSPPVLSALCKVVGQHDLATDMSLEEVQKLALRSKRKVHACPSLC